MAQAQRRARRYFEVNKLSWITENKERKRKGGKKKTKQLGWSRTESWKYSRLRKLVGFWFLMDPSWSLTKAGV